MRKMVRVFLLGIAIWALPFFLGMAIFPIIPPETALFDTTMSVVAALSATLLSVVHFSRCRGPDLDEGLLTGTVWMLMALGLDVPFFIVGPTMMRMQPADYLADIGFNYVMIPIIAGGIAHAFKRA